MIIFVSVPRAANAIVSFGEYMQNIVTVNFTIPVRSSISLIIIIIHVTDYVRVYW